MTPKSLQSSAEKSYQSALRASSQKAASISTRDYLGDVRDELERDWWFDVSLSTAPRKLVTTERDVFVDLVVVVGVNVEFDGDGDLDMAGERRRSARATAAAEGR